MRIHFLEANDLIIAYFPDTLRFFEINEIVKKVITSYINLEDKNLAMQKFNLSGDTYDSFIKKIEEYSVANKVLPKKVEKVSDIKILNKLVLNVSNKCNLRCKYCYADGGNYGCDEDLMTIDVAKQTLDIFYSQFSKINTIQLFGGEPLMNLNTIEFICEYINMKYNKVNLKDKPLIGLVTNGTLINDKVIDIIKRYDLTITVSLDGQPAVNDAMRVFENEKGTSEVIVNNIKMLKNQTNQPTTIESTYNKHHVLNNISVIDVINYMNENFKNTSFHIVPAGGSSDCSYVLDNKDSFVDSVDDVFDSIREGNPVTYSLVHRIIEGLQTKKCSSYICGAGSSTISVSTDGSIYPCFMFTGNENLQLGNVFDKNIFQSDRYISGISKFTSFSKFENKKCKNCYINTLCSGCHGINYMETNQVLQLSDSWCEMSREMVKKVIVNLVKLKKTTFNHLEETR